MPLPSGIILTETTGLAWTLANIEQDPMLPTLFVSTGTSLSYDKVGYSSPLVNGTDNVYFTVNFSNTDGTGRFAYVGLTQTMDTTDAVSQYASKIDIGFKREGSSVFVVINGAETGTQIGDVTSEYTIIQRSNKFDVYIKDLTTNAYSLYNQEYYCPLRNGQTYALAMAIYESGTQIQVVGGSTSEAPVFSVPSAPTAVISMNYNIADIAIIPPISGGNAVITDYELRFNTPNSSSYTSASLGLSPPGVSLTYEFPEEAAVYDVKLVAVNPSGAGEEFETTVNVNVKYTPDYYLYPLETGGYNIRINHVIKGEDKFIGQLYVPATTYTKDSQPPLNMAILDSSNGLVEAFDYISNNKQVSLAYNNNYGFKFGSNPDMTIYFSTTEVVDITYEISEITSDSAKLKITSATFAVADVGVPDELSIKIYSSKSPDPILTIPYSSFNTDVTINGLESNKVNTLQLKVYNTSLGLLSNVSQEIQITTTLPPFSGFVYPIKLLSVSGSAYAMFSNDLRVNGSLIGNANVPILDTNMNNTNTVMNPTTVYTADLAQNSSYYLSWSGQTLSFTTNEYFLGTITYEVGETTADITVTAIPKRGSGYGIYAVNQDSVDYDITGLIDFKLELWTSASKIDEKLIDGSSSYTFNLTGLTSETAYTDYFLKVTGSSNLNNASGSFEGSAQPPLSFTTTAAGGGGSGGGGNNGGNGHNNMATLTYNPPYALEAAYGETVVVYGETGVPQTGYNLAIALDVSKSTLNSILTFTKSGEEEATDFKIDLSGISSAVKAALDADLATRHALPSLSSMGIDARSVKSHEVGSWDADVAPLNVADLTETARNVYEQAADKGKLSTTEGKLNLDVGDTFVFYVDMDSTQSLTITIDEQTLTGAAKSDVAPLIPFAAIFGASNAEGDKGTISKTWSEKFTVTVTATA